VHHRQSTTPATTKSTQPQWKAVPNPVDGSTGWWSRCHVQFGWEYRYGSDRNEEAFDVLFQPAPEVPSWLMPSKLAAEAVCTHMFRRPIVFDQCIINRYVDAQGIRNHIDHKMFGPIIACHTFGVGSRMNFWNPHDQTEYNLHVAPNSLYVMSGDVRTSWFHGMPTQQQHSLGSLRQGGGRYSITWRTLLKGNAASEPTTTPTAPIVVVDAHHQQFCRAFFHIDECFEWKQRGLCLNGDGVCLRNDVQAIACIDTRDGESFVARYGNQFRGSSETNVHAEEEMVRDARLLAALATAPVESRRLTVYLAFQPCHHSGGGRSMSHVHTKSCASLVLDWFQKMCLPMGARLRIKCCGLYRAHWEEPALFASRSDAELFGDRTSRAQQGLLLLLRQPGITVEAMDREDWVRLQQLTLSASLSTISQVHWIVRYATDEHIATFLRKLASSYKIPTTK